jgi:hypothetical protein
VSGPIIFTRREFLQRTAAASALLAAGGVLGACTSDGGDPPASSSTPGGGDPDVERIVRVAVHPSIGIARVGNSADSFFFGPDVPGALPVAPDGFKDASGAIARQAARFRLYGYDADGQVVKELTAADGAIAWAVSVANKKAAWYDFDTAMDIPVAESVARRNDDITGSDRDRLVIASGTQTISGPNAEPVALDAGRFLDERVPQGELMTDELGRLVFVPADGRGYSPGNAPLTTFSDNDGWADDTCDGPVLATIELGGRTLEADSAWVVVTPPNYGPGLTAGLVTAFDSSRLGWDTDALAALGIAPASTTPGTTPGTAPAGTTPGTTPGTAPGEGAPGGAAPPETTADGVTVTTHPNGFPEVVPDEQPTIAIEPVSFSAEVLPIFERIVDMQWVNAGFLGSNGWGSGADYTDPEWLDRLADPSPGNAEVRGRLFEQFRDPGYDAEEPDAVPQVYGDGVAIPAESAYQWLTVTPIQYAHLRAWAAGNFVDDRGDDRPTELDQVPLADQPRSLDRAGLDACLGGAYHPGIELPWTLRVPSMWSGPLRLKVLSTTVDNPDYGERLTPEVTMAADGPVAGSGPGDLTRWQGTPWQSDAASCRSGYQPDISPVLPTFWPARIPNHVLREEDYLIVVDTSAPMDDRVDAFERRYDWERFITAAGRTATLDNMIEGWGKLGIVTEQPGPTDGAFPRVMKVETHVGFPTEPTVSWNAASQESNPQVWDGAPVTGPPTTTAVTTPPGTTAE